MSSLQLTSRSSSKRQVGFFRVFLFVGGREIYEQQQGEQVLARKVLVGASLLGNSCQHLVSDVFYLTWGTNDKILVLGDM